MTARILDGKAIAADIRQTLADDVRRLVEGGVTPGLAVVLVGDDPASRIYVRMKDRAASAIGISAHTIRLPEQTTQKEIMDIVRDLNHSADVHGILVQLPLPRGIDPAAVIEAIDPAKDVDGLHPYNAGRLALGNPTMIPCTPLGIMELLRRAEVPLTGTDAVILGRSNLVGKPMAALLLKENATVTVCHSKSKDIETEVRRADLLISAVGRPGLVRGEWIRPGATVIDVGINRLPDGTLAGDVEFEAATARAGVITPVPGGVGPLTVAMLLSNTVAAASAALSDFMPRPGQVH